MYGRDEECFVVEFEDINSIVRLSLVLNKPITSFKSALKTLPKGLLKAVTVEVAKRIEDGSFDSLKKIQILDEVCGTDFGKMIHTGE